MQTYYDMLDDGTREWFEDEWEGLADTAAAASELLEALSSSSSVPEGIAGGLADALAEPMAARALADPGNGGADLFEERADAAGADGPAAFEAVARSAIDGMVEAKVAMRRAASALASRIGEVAEEAGALHEMARDAAYPR